MKKTYTFVMSFGYAENESLGSIAYESSVKFPTARAALIDLATFFKEHFEKSETSTVRSAPACKNCGHVEKVEEEEFDAQGYVDFVRGLYECDTDTLHANYVEYDEGQRWQHVSVEDAFRKGANARFLYTAENVLVTALGHEAHPGHTLDTLFKKRDGNAVHFW